jgi:hypothetical protein
MSFNPKKIYRGMSNEERATLATTHQSDLKATFPMYTIRQAIALRKLAVQERRKIRAAYLEGKAPKDGQAALWVSKADLQKRKKQEYNENMGAVYDALETGKAEDPAGIAQYLNDLAADEQGFRVQRKARSLSISAANELLLHKHIEARLEAIMPGLKARRYGYARRRGDSTTRINRSLQNLWTDQHMGASLPGRELPQAYGIVEERRRFAKVVSNVCEYKRDYRDRTALRVFDAGDNIEGFLAHDLRSGEPLADQFVLRVEYSIQAIQHLAAEFPHVDVHYDTGNHDRNKMRHPGRATYQKWDSFQTMIAHAVRLACRDLPNVTFHIDRRPYTTVDILGHAHFVTHGDTHLNAGNPGKTLKVDKLLSQINSINATRRYGSAFEVFAMGHVHTSVQAQIEDCDIFINGPLCPSGGYADGSGYFSSASQWIWETTEKYAVGDMRRVSVGPDTDADASLDNVIRPVTEW